MKRPAGESLEDAVSDANDAQEQPAGEQPPPQQQQQPVDEAQLQAAAGLVALTTAAASIQQEQQQQAGASGLVSQPTPEQSDILLQEIARLSAENRLNPTAWPAQTLAARILAAAALQQQQQQQAPLNPVGEPTGLGPSTAPNPLGSPPAAPQLPFPFGLPLVGFPSAQPTAFGTPVNPFAAPPTQPLQPLLQHDPQMLVEPPETIQQRQWALQQSLLQQAEQAEREQEQQEDEEVEIEEAPAACTTPVRRTTILSPEEALNTLQFHANHDRQLPMMLQRDTNSSCISEFPIGHHKIVGFLVGGEPRLCLPQLRAFVFPEYEEVDQLMARIFINNANASPGQLRQMIDAGALPKSIGVCPLITRTNAEKLINWLMITGVRPLHGLGNVDTFMDAERRASLQSEVIHVEHCIFGTQKGRYYPSLRGEACLECADCDRLFTPPEFVRHAHRADEEFGTVEGWCFNAENWSWYMSLDYDRPFGPEEEAEFERLTDTHYPPVHDGLSTAALPPEQQALLIQQMQNMTPTGNYPIPRNLPHREEHLEASTSSAFVDQPGGSADRTATSDRGHDSSTSEMDHEPSTSGFSASNARIDEEPPKTNDEEEPPADGTS